LKERHVNIRENRSLRYILDELYALDVVGMEKKNYCKASH